MKYKIVSLIMIIPVVLMLCVFSATNIVSLTVPIPVIGINLNNSNQEYLDIANINDKVSVKANVEPTNATNKSIIYTTEPVEGKKEARVVISPDGDITALDVGTVKVICTTVDGAYIKSFILEVGSTKATDLVVSLPNGEDSVLVGDSFTLLSQIYPSYIDTQVEWSSLDENILTINRFTGVATALSAGEVTVQAKVSDGIDGDIIKNITINVVDKATNSGIMINGTENYTTKTYNNRLNMLAYINLQGVDTDFDMTGELLLLDYDTSEILNIQKIKKSNSLFELVIDVKEDFIGQSLITASIDLPQYEDKTATINIDKVGDVSDFEININGLKNYLKLGAKNLFDINIDPVVSGATFSIDIEDSAILSYIGVDNLFELTALQVGETEVTITTRLNNVILNEYQTTISILNPSNGINLTEQQSSYGIGKQLAIGGFKLNGDNYEQDKYKFGLTTEIPDELLWETSDSNVATISDQGELQIINDGIVTVSATIIDTILLGNPEKSSVTVRCVKDAVNVSSYNELMKASKDKKPIVLKNSIDLGEKLINVKEDGSVEIVNDRSYSQCASILREEVSEMPTTYEWNYYKYAENYDTPPTVKYCIRFDNDLYGNGYTLNANNITNLVDGTGALYDFAVFRGALDYVGLKSASGTDTSSVKGQDNIAFVIGEGAMIDNVEFVGANLRGNTSADLTQLNYVGTTVEVVGDNVEINNTRIRNGKNVLRVYGDESDSMKKINVTLNSCILSHAREFIVKLGTNAVVKGNLQDNNLNLSQGLSENSQVWQDCAPSIENFRHLNDKALSNTEYENLVQDYLSDEEYQSLIKTSLTLSNCSLITSGLFSIGIEGRFAGPALDGARWNSWDFYQQGWRDIAGTAYPVQLNLQGSVKLYDWKDLSKIDSSTLMEGNMFSLDMSGMINAIGKNQEYQNIITEGNNGEKYVHGGIVMFGGGKNYALINFGGQTEKLNNFAVTLKEIDAPLTTMMTYAAGKEAFRFFVYDKSSVFNYNQQVLEMSNGTAYTQIGSYTY